MNNYNFFESSEFSSWAYRDTLILEEEFLFNKYIFQMDRSAKILDLGTGNGRFLFELGKKGFNNLYGIDLADRLLLFARERLKNYPFITLSRMSVSDLCFDSNSFDLVIGLQQVISFIENINERNKAFYECYRVLKQNGLFIASFLHYDGRWFNTIMSYLILPIKFYKKDFIFIKHQYLPWLKLGGKINFEYIYKIQPYLYWFKKNEVLIILEDAGFKMLEIKTSKMIYENTDAFKNGGMLYIVAKK